MLPLKSSLSNQSTKSRLLASHAGQPPNLSPVNPLQPWLCDHLSRTSHKGRRPQLEFRAVHSNREPLQSISHRPSKKLLPQYTVPPTQHCASEASMPPAQYQRQNNHRHNRTANARLLLAAASNVRLRRKLSGAAFRLSIREIDGPNHQAVKSKPTQHYVAEANSCPTASQLSVNRPLNSEGAPPPSNHS